MFVVICYRGELYKIPPSSELLQNVAVPEAIHVHPEEGSAKVNVKELFAFNDMVFQLYLEKSLREKSLHPNFYMFVDEILYFIKLNNLEEEVSEYWQKLINK